MTNAEALRAWDESPESTLKFKLREFDDREFAQKFLMATRVMTGDEQAEAFAELRRPTTFERTSSDTGRVTTHDNRTTITYDRNSVEQILRHWERMMYVQAPPRQNANSVIDRYTYCTDPAGTWTVPYNTLAGTGGA